MYYTLFSNPRVSNWKIGKQINANLFIVNQYFLDLLITWDNSIIVFQDNKIEENVNEKNNTKNFTKEKKLRKKLDYYFYSMELINAP